MGMCWMETFPGYSFYGMLLYPIRICQIIMGVGTMVINWDKNEMDTWDTNLVRGCSFVCFVTCSCWVILYPVYVYYVNKTSLDVKRQMCFEKLALWTGARGKLIVTPK